MNEDYNKDASRLKDLLRGSVVCRSIDDFGACFRGLAQLERSGVATIETIKNSVRDGARDSGYMDANVILRFDGFLVEVQLQLEAIYEIKKAHHDAHVRPVWKPRAPRRPSLFARNDLVTRSAAATSSDLMGALAEPPAPEARARPRAVHNAARLVPLAMSLTMALLYVDAFVLKGASVLIERVTTLPTRGFSPPFVLLRFYGLVLALPSSSSSPTC